jgi:hypothetical protein
MGRGDPCQHAVHGDARGDGVGVLLVDLRRVIAQGEWDRHLPSGGRDLHGVEHFGRRVHLRHVLETHLNDGVGRQGDALEVSDGAVQFC